MKHQGVDIHSLPILNALVSDYLQGEEKVEHLYQYVPDLSSFKQVIDDKKKNYTARETLVTSLKNQYKKIDSNQKVLDNIESLANENTFTICTAHQLCLFTGPLYFIYKIASAIALSRQLKVVYPSYNFVPIYWMGSEDHDFEEVNHLHLYGKTVSWEKEVKGAVGRLENDGMTEVISELKEILGEETSFNELARFFEEEKNYGLAFQRMVDYLFGKYGLVVLNQDDKNLKTAFSEEMKRELSSSFIQRAMQSHVDFLENNYHVQAAPREINLFYLKDNLRERIVRTDNGFAVNNTSITFSAEEMLEELDNHPERFSPNVSMRPLYQEKILPNLAYVGGAGELSYWLQQKEVFEVAKVNFPMLLLRDMAMILPKAVQKKMGEWSLDMAAMFSTKDELIKRLVKEDAASNLSLDKAKEELQNLFSAIENQANTIDKSLEGSVKAELQKSLKGIANIESKMLRAEKRNQEQLVNQISKAKDKLFPNGKLQERYDNFLPYYLEYGDEFIQNLIEAFNPLENVIHVFEE